MTEARMDWLASLDVAIAPYVDVLDAAGYGRWRHRSRLDAARDCGPARFKLTHYRSVPNVTRRRLQHR